MWSTILALDATTGSTGSPSSTRDGVDHVDRERIGDRDQHAVRAIAAERQHEVLAREVDRQLVDQLGRDVLGARQVAQVRHLELERERERELVLVDQLAAAPGPRRAGRPPRAASRARARSNRARRRSGATRISPMPAA